MRNISDTIARLSAFKGVSMGSVEPGDKSRLAPLRDFGSNPGALLSQIYIPKDLRDGAPLVVVLHGCTQTAAGYDNGAGWSQMADRHGFAVLFPEQQRQNNPNLCFNWFAPLHSRRGSGEALSIRQMIEAVQRLHRIDSARVYVTGLSAGGAMAATMLAAYPEVFAGGAVIAGLPYGCASTVPQAFDRMRGHGIPGEAELTALVRRASEHSGPWPRLSVWHGTTDATVHPVNAQAVVDQWRTLHDVPARPSRIETVHGFPRRVWCDATGREVIEEFTIAGMGHGTPLDTRGDAGCGKSAAFMLDVGISSTSHICSFWGISQLAGATAQNAPPSAAATAEQQADTRDLVPAGRARPSDWSRFHRVNTGDTDHHTHHAATGVRKVIEDALSAAGLMR